MAIIGNIPYFQTNPKFENLLEMRYAMLVFHTMLSHGAAIPVQFAILFPGAGLQNTGPKARVSPAVGYPAHDLDRSWPWAQTQAAQLYQRQESQKGVSENVG